MMPPPPYKCLNSSDGRIATTCGALCIWISLDMSPHHHNFCCVALQESNEIIKVSRRHLQSHKNLLSVAMRDWTEHTLWHWTV